MPNLLTGFKGSEEKKQPSEKVTSIENNTQKTDKSYLYKIWFGILDYHGYVSRREFLKTITFYIPAILILIGFTFFLEYVNLYDIGVFFKVVTAILYVLFIPASFSFFYRRLFTINKPKYLLVISYALVLFTFALTEGGTIGRFVVHGINVLCFVYLMYMCGTRKNEQ